MQAYAFLAGLMLAGAAVSLPFAWADRERRGPIFLAALAMMAALWSFSAVIAGLPTGGDLALPVEAGGMALAGCFLFGALECSTGRLRFFPFVLAGGVMIAFGSALIAFERWDSVAAGFWAGCTASGIWHYTARGGQWRKAKREDRPVLAVAVSFAVINAVLLVRMSWNGPGAEMIILIAGPAVLSLAGALASRELAMQFAAPARRYEKSGVSDAAAQELFGRIEALMAEKKAFTDPSLDRDKLAGLLGADPRAVGEAVNRAGGASVAAYLRQQRLSEADRLLRAPENARISLEALGMQAGFRSRSRFYAAFEEVYGETPGARRERLKAAG